jgi:hypothetical protein
VKHAKNRQIINGREVAAHPKSPFRELSSLNDNFLNYFKSRGMPNSILESFMFIDTPGMFPGKASQFARDYDFVKAVKWFAKRSDRILLFFDPTKLEIGDEMKRCIQALNDYDFKFRILLNKASSLGSSELLTYIGELEFNLGKIMQQSEVPQIFVVSFEKATEDKLNTFTEDQESILNDLAELPKNAAQKKMSKFNQRVRQVLLHAYVMKEIKGKLPWLFEIVTSFLGSKFGIGNYLMKDVAGNLEKIVAMIKEEYSVLRDCKYDTNKLKAELLELVIFIYLFFALGFFDIFLINRNGAK